MTDKTPPQASAVILSPTGEDWQRFREELSEALDHNRERISPAARARHVFAYMEAELSQRHPGATITETEIICDPTRIPTYFARLVASVPGQPEPIEMEWPL